MEGSKLHPYEFLKAMEFIEGFWVWAEVWSELLAPPPFFVPRTVIQQMFWATRKA